MAEYINGFGGSVLFNAITVHVMNWTLTVNADPIDTTNTGDAGWESNILGCKNWEASLKMGWDSSDIPTGNWVAGDLATLSLKVGNLAKTYVGVAFLTKIEVVNEPKGEVMFNANFKGNGALTYAS